MAKSAAQLLYGPVLVFQSVVPLLTNLRIYILHPFVAVHVVCSTAVFVIFLVVTIDYKCPTPAAPWIPSENIFMQRSLQIPDLQTSLFWSEDLYARHLWDGTTCRYATGLANTQD